MADQPKFTKKNAVNKGNSRKKNLPKQKPGSPSEPSKPTAEPNDPRRSKILQMIKRGVLIALAMMKRPLGDDWNINPITLGSFEKRYKPGMNYVVLTGQPFRKGTLKKEGHCVVVLDIDKPDLAKETLARFPAISKHYHVHSQKGIHVYFILDPGEPLPKGQRHDDWDFQSTGTCVVGEESIHPDSGKKYRRKGRFNNMLSWSEYGLKICETMPGWKDKKSSGHYKPNLNKLKAMISGAKEIKEGSRNNSAFEFGVTSKLLGVEYNEAISLLHQFCDNCKPPFEYEEALEAFKSGYNRSQQNAPGIYEERVKTGLESVMRIVGQVLQDSPPVPWEEYPKLPFTYKLEEELEPFPLVSLPKFIREMAEEVVKGSPGTPISYVAAIGVGLLGAAIGKAFKVGLRRAIPSTGTFTSFVLCYRIWVRATACRK